MRLRPSVLVVVTALVAAACAPPAPEAKSEATVDLPSAPSAPSPTAPPPSDAPVAGAPSHSARARFDRLPEAQRRAYRDADLIVVARLDQPRIDSILEIAPPIYVHAFDVVTDRRLAGGALPDRVTAHLSSREITEPFAAKKPMIVALRRVTATLEEGTTYYQATSVEPASDELADAIASARTTVDASLSWTVSQVPPANPQRWSNDYGDGEFDLTLRNDGTAPRRVPGLYEVGGVVKLAEAIVVRDETGRALPVSKTPLPAGAKPVTLAPGATLTARVDVKPFGIVHPAGGSRYVYSFGLGELRTSSFFYYLHTLHGPSMGKV